MCVNLSHIKGGIALQELKDVLTKLRKNARLSQQQVADILKINRSTYAYYETGKSKPKLPTLKKLAAIYGVSLDDLLGRERSGGSELAVSETPYDAGWHADTQVSALSDFEQAVLLKLRLMNREQKEKLLDFMEENLDK